MKYFKPTAVSSSRRPELGKNESLIAQQGQIGLYEGKRKLENYQDGVCYLTSHRIVYVDSANPLENSIEISLQVIKDIESYGGFLRSSPKIIINIDPNIKLKVESIATQKDVGNVWACTICFFSNQASSENCELCGVRKQQTSIITASSSSPSQQEQQQQQQQNPVTTDSSACVVCTFMNHPSMVQCEMCGADLPREVIPTPTTSTNSVVSASDANPQIRLSFRQGGQSSFLSKLKSALAEKKWEITSDSRSGSSSSLMETTPKRGVGITAIEDRIQKTTLEANNTLSDAFQDLDALMAKATEMVRLAESISNKVSKDPANDDNELSTLRTHLLNLGIASPVTKGSAGSIYHQELAKELADFLGNFFHKQDDMKALTDVYCLFNRARGVALISPEDLYKASQQFEPLKLPFRLRKFSSGLLVIQSTDMNDNRAASRVLKHIKEKGSLSALQLAEIEKLALAVASEQLIVAERMGFICRDEGPSGLTFYENLFLIS